MKAAAMMRVLQKHNTNHMRACVKDDFYAGCNSILERGNKQYHFTQRMNRNDDYHGLNAKQTVKTVMQNPQNTCTSFSTKGF